MTTLPSNPLIVPLVTMVFLPMILGMVAYLIPKGRFKAFVIVFQAAMFFVSCYYLFQLKNTPAIIEYLSRLPLPLGMSLRLDRLSGAMLLLSNFLFCMLLLFNYHKHYMDGRFYFLFLSLQGLINGIFLSNDLFNIYLMVEVATIVVGVLIMYKKDAMAMYDGMIYLLVNMVAMAFFLFGIGFIYKHFGRFDLSGIEAAMLRVTLVKPLYLPFALMFTAVCLKAAVLPLYSWLPKAHSTASAPSIVSAVLSGIFVKTGLYLLIRVTGLFDAALDVSEFVRLLGVLTAIFGFIFAVAQTDIKAVLAYHTISQVGLMLMGFFSGDQTGYSGGLLHLLNHGVFKSLLFLCAGILVEVYRNRELSRFGGVLKVNLVLAGALIVGILSITGAPFFSGGTSKYLIGSAYNGGIGSWMVWFISLGTLVSFSKLAFYIFRPASTGVYSNIGAAPYKLRWNQVVVLLIMSGVCLSLGQLGTHGHYVLTGAKALGNIWFNETLLIGLISRKWFEFAWMSVLAYVIYRWILAPTPLLEYVRRIDLSYNSIMLAVVLFFTSSLIFVSNMTVVSQILAKIPW